MSTFKNDYVAMREERDALRDECDKLRRQRDKLTEAAKFITDVYCLQLEEGSDAFHVAFEMNQKAEEVLNEIEKESGE